MERIGVAFTTGSLSPPEVVECVQLAQELGYESAWVAERHGGDQFSILTACALATSRIRLGASISSAFVHSAPNIATAAACVDHYSQGRFVLGLDSSHKVQLGQEHGPEFLAPIPRIRDTVDIVRRLLRYGNLVGYEGEVTNIQSFDLHFPVFRTELPIYLAAVFPRMLEIAGEISQGILLTWCTPEHARAAADHVAAGAGRAGDNPASVELATLLPVPPDGAGDGGMRSVAASYAGQFPLYRRLMAEAGFADEVELVGRAWREGNVAQAEQLVPDGLIHRMLLPTDPVARKERLAEYGESGVTLPIIAPRVSGPNAAAAAQEIIRANAPA